MVLPRLSTGQSDPVSYTCNCPAASSSSGLVLLFYRYFANCPPLHSDHHLPSRSQVKELAAWHTTLTTRLQLTGKIRVALEGFNVTVAGTSESITAYVAACVPHWSFANLPLSTAAEQDAFFKPSPGCRCVFIPATKAAIRVCAEITPLGITDYAPSTSSWGLVDELPPAEFHARCHGEGKVELMDLRNHYESRIGYFIDPHTGQTALRPRIRRFSQFPKFVKRRLAGPLSSSPPQVLTYCTGGIRCEKTTRWMAEQAPEGGKICTLKGGIAAYLDWMNSEIAAGRKTTDESLFKGRNYVFDGRGSTGLSVFTEPVSQCHICGKTEDRLSKCRSTGCHLVLVVCDACEGDDVRCCRNCEEREKEIKLGNRIVRKGMCECEEAREMELWGEQSVAKTTAEVHSKAIDEQARKTIAETRC